jgi:hypothetical protein
MNPPLTETATMLGRSCSQKPVREAAFAAVQGLIKPRFNVARPARLTLVQFDDAYERPSAPKTLKNRRRYWPQRLRHQLQHILPTLLLTLIYLAGALLFAFQHCRLSSLLCVIAAVATLFARHRAERPLRSRSRFPHSPR